MLINWPGAKYVVYEDQVIEVQQHYDGTRMRFFLISFIDIYHLAATIPTKQFDSSCAYPSDFRGPFGCLAVHTDIPNAPTDASITLRMEHFAEERVHFLHATPY